MTDGYDENFFRQMMADLDLANLEEFEQDVLANPQYHDLSENDMAALAAVNRRIREGTVADTNVATVPSRAAKELELVPSYTLKDLTGTDLAKLVESAAKKQSLSLFFSLLVEDCRDLIYKELLQDGGEPIKVEYKPTELTWIPTDLANMMMACRSTYLEASPIIHLKTTFLMKPDAIFGLFLAPGFFNRDNIHRLHIAWPLKKGDNNMCGTSELWPTSSILLHCLEAFPNLKHLEISVPVHCRLEEEDLLSRGPEYDANMAFDADVQPDPVALLAHEQFPERYARYANRDMDDNEIADRLVRNLKRMSVKNQARVIKQLLVWPVPRFVHGMQEIEECASTMRDFQLVLDAKREEKQTPPPHILLALERWEKQKKNKQDSNVVLPGALPRKLPKVVLCINTYSRGARFAVHDIEIDVYGRSFIWRRGTKRYRFDEAYQMVAEQQLPAALLAAMPVAQIEEEDRVSPALMMVAEAEEETEE